MYLIRLDDASEYMDTDKWSRIERLFDKYSIKPIVGIIPNNKDDELIKNYTLDYNFWNKARKWQEKGWDIALHGFTHVYISEQGGINPVNNRSEFAGVPLEKQREKIKKGMRIFQEKGINTEMFFAPSHTFDMNTLKALELESDIRVISDTIANDIYKMSDFYFIPQQSGNVRKLPFNITTFCYHPNNMSELDFENLDGFLSENNLRFTSFKKLELRDRELNLYDKFLRKTYFMMRELRKIIKR